MEILNIADEFTILKGEKSAEPKYRQELSKKIIAKFGKGPYTAEVISEILLFCKDYYITEFEKTLFAETSYCFYREIIWLNEQASQLRQSKHFNNLPEDIDKGYIAEYRRILKMIIEQACGIDMITGEKRNPDFIIRIRPIFDDLFYLGKMLFAISESLAEQQMIEDSLDISFDKNDLFVMSRRHHYEFIFKHIVDKQEAENPVFIIDEKGSNDFKAAIKENFGIEYEQIWQVAILHMEKDKLEYGDCITVQRESFEKNFETYSEHPLEKIQKLLSGMTLSRDNKMPLTELLRKPNSLNRFLFRPFLVWKIDAKEYYVFGIVALYEAENSLYLNALPWKKIPQEWSDNAGFKKYVDRKHDEHDKWLDDKIENDIISTGLKYDVHVKTLQSKSKAYSLLTEDLGEIDFIIISPVTKKVLIVDCKHLLGRYDMVNQKNDYDHFVKDGKHKSYITRMNLKTTWLKENKQILEEHFQLKYNDPNISLKDFTIEGVFFINTPTFHMYNSDVRIYTHQQVINVITGEHVDITFTCMVDDEESNTMYNIKYPYFRKPKLLYYFNEDDDCEVDKYGYPIKNKSTNKRKKNKSKK